jgi:hypothetical protein
MKKTVLAIMLLATAAAAQTSPETTRLTAMKKMDFLLGEWSGDGWMMLGRDNKVTFHQTENVRSAAGGSVVVIDGLGTNPAGKPVHQAFAVISFDTTSGKYMWRAFTKVNGEVGVEPEIGDRTLVWGFPTPAGKTRFTITLTPAGEWHEIGDFSRDGTAWSQFFEMTLKRK